MASQKKTFWQQFRALDIYLDKIFPFLFLILLIVIFRLPYLFEPHYYLDEGIYLTLGQGLKDGSLLYLDLFDHKTPLIYVVASIFSTFFSWRLAHFFIAIISFILFYILAKKMFPSKLAVFISSLLFLLGANLPIWEGNVFNGELLTIFFVLIGVNLIYAQFTRSPLVYNRLRTLFLLGGGASFGLAFLTKFHGGFDFIIFLLLPLLFLPVFHSKNYATIKQRILDCLQILLGFLIPVALTVIVFFIQGNLAYFWEAAFNYNFVYTAHAGNYNVYKIVGLLFIMIVLWWQRTKINKNIILLVCWTLITFIAANLSGRPYPHYFLQVVPPLCLLIGSFVNQLMTTKFNAQWFKQTFFNLNMGILIVTFAVSAVVYKNMGLTSNNSFHYYQNFWTYLTKKQNRDNYYNYFGALTIDNYQIASLIMRSDNKDLFIWGNNPVLYSLTHKSPALKPFTVNFHLYDYANHVPNLYLATNSTSFVRERFTSAEPFYVVKMHQTDNREKEIIDELALENILANNYVLLYNGTELSLWQKK